MTSPTTIEENRDGRVPQAAPGSSSLRSPEPPEASRPLRGDDPSRGEVKVAGNGRTIRDAFLLSSLAVHRSVNFGAPWTITHRATGCAIGRSCCELSALAAAKDIEQQHPKALAELNKLKFGETAPHKRRPAAVTRLVRYLEEKGLR